MELQELKEKALHEMRATWYQNQIPSLAYDLMGKVIRDYVCVKHKHVAAMEYPYADEQPPAFELRYMYVEGTTTNTLFKDDVFDTPWFASVENAILQSLREDNVIPNTLRVSLNQKHRYISGVEVTIGVLK
jgi:hypothetical protein